MPSTDFRMHTSRLLIELEEFKKAVKVLDSVIQEDDENAESWYLLAFSLVKMKKFKNANECMKNVELLMESQKITDEELKQGSKELRITINENLQPSEAEMEDEGASEGEGDGEGYETYSEEDVSDDDVDMKD